MSCFCCCHDRLNELSTLKIFKRKCKTGYDSLLFSLCGRHHWLCLSLCVRKMLVTSTAGYASHFVSCLLLTAEVHVGKPGGGFRGPLERSVRSLPSAWTGEATTWEKILIWLWLAHPSCFLCVTLNYMSTACTALYNMILYVCPGGYRECSVVRPLCGGLLHLPLAPGPRWRAIWAQGVVQHRGGPFGASAHDGWWDSSVTLCHTTGRTKSYYHKKEIMCWYYVIKWMNFK